MKKYALIIVTSIITIQTLSCSVRTGLLVGATTSAGINAINIARLIRIKKRIKAEQNKVHANKSVDDAALKKMLQQKQNIKNQLYLGSAGTLMFGAGYLYNNTKKDDSKKLSQPNQQPSTLTTNTPVPLTTPHKNDGSFDKYCQYLTHYTDMFTVKDRTVIAQNMANILKARMAQRRKNQEVEKHVHSIHIGTVYKTKFGNLTHAETPNTSDYLCVAHSSAKALTGQDFIGSNFLLLIAYEYFGTHSLEYFKKTVLSSHPKASFSFQKSMQALANWSGRPIYIWQWPNIFENNSKKMKTIIPLEPNTLIDEWKGDLWQTTQNYFEPKIDINWGDENAIHLFLQATKDYYDTSKIFNIHCEYLIQEHFLTNKLANSSINYKMFDQLKKKFESRLRTIYHSLFIKKGNTRKDGHSTGLSQNKNYDIMHCLSWDLKTHFEVYIQSLASATIPNELIKQLSNGEYRKLFLSCAALLKKFKTTPGNSESYKRIVTDTTDIIEILCRFYNELLGDHFSLLRRLLLWEDIEQDYGWLSLFGKKKHSFFTKKIWLTTALKQIPIGQHAALTDAIMNTEDIQCFFDSQGVPLMHNSKITFANQTKSSAVHQAVYFILYNQEKPTTYTKTAGQILLNPSVSFPEINPEILETADIDTLTTTKPLDNPLHSLPEYQNIKEEAEKLVTLLNTYGISLGIWYIKKNKPNTRELLTGYLYGQNTQRIDVLINTDNSCSVLYASINSYTLPPQNSIMQPELSSKDTTLLAADINKLLKGSKDLSLETILKKRNTTT
jgi:hypothetical protein